MTAAPQALHPPAQIENTAPLTLFARLDFFHHFAQLALDPCLLVQKDALNLVRGEAGLFHNCDHEGRFRAAGIESLLGR
jgi:hypothetical protein